MKNSMMFLVLFFILISFAYAAGPVMPTPDLKSEVKIDLSTLDLPYKPVSVDAEGNLVTEAGETLSADVKPEKKIDWSKVPYVPSRYPDIGPAGDPAL